MEQDRWERVEAMFDHLVDKSPSHRSDYLDILCENDVSLREEVERLLAANDAIESGERSWAVTDELWDKTPKQIGDYAIRYLLGSGGIGSVYASAHPRFGDVALKLLPKFFVSDSAARRRFDLEAKALGQLQHPAVCRLYECLVTDDYACIAMELVEGRELRSLIEEGPLTYAEALGYVGQLADALDAAHAHDVCHRDIKPGNIMIPRSDRTTLKLIDFGIAKFADVKLTATGKAVGSPRYMSPEQWQGLPIDGRSDLWSLGVLWYEMLTGRKPFDGNSLPEIAASVMAAEPLPLPPASVDGRPLAECSAVIGDLLRPRPPERIGSCAELKIRLLAL